MGSVEQRAFRTLTLAVALGLWACGLANDAPSSTAMCDQCAADAGPEPIETAQGEPNVPPSVCPYCPEDGGGESSDFGGTPTLCSALEQQLEIDAATASELGFDVRMLEQRIGREIDAPLHWRAEPSEHGEPATGYEPETRVQARARITSWTHVQPDPASCQGTFCRLRDAEIICSDRLEVGVELELRSLDGAIETVATGYALQGREDFPFGDNPAGSAFASLRHVTGMLELHPDPDLIPAAGVPLELGDLPYSAAMLVDFSFLPHETTGALRIEMWFRDGDAGALGYRPLSATWPDPR